MAEDTTVALDAAMVVVIEGDWHLAYGLASRDRETADATRSVVAVAVQVAVAKDDETNPAWAEEPVSVGQWVFAVVGLDRAGLDEVAPNSAGPMVLVVRK